MNLYMPPGELNPDAPEVWGHLHFSTYSGLWMIDWYSLAHGDIEGATIANGDQYQWAETHPEEIAAEWEEIKAWKLRLWESRNIRKSDPVNWDDDIPF